MAPTETEIQDYLSHWQCRNGMDFYNSSAMKYAYGSGVYFLFPSYFHHDNDEAVIRIATSRDSRNFQRIDQVLIPPEAAPDFRAKQQYLACGMLTGNNDSLLLYTEAVDVGHDELSRVDDARHVVVGYEFQQDGFIGQYSDHGTLTTHYLDVPENCRKVKLRAQIAVDGMCSMLFTDENGKRISISVQRRNAANSGTVLEGVLPENIKKFQLNLQIEKATVFSLEIL